MAQVRVRKRGKTFSYIFEAGKKSDGKRKVVEKGGFKTKDAAYKAGVEAYNDFLHGNIGITSEAITLRDFMTSWLDNVVALNVKVTSLQLYKSLMNNQITPRLGEIKVQELTPAMLDKWIRQLQRAGLSRNTIRRARALIHQALGYAVYPAQIISSNPADYIKVPNNAPREIIKRHVITPERFKALLEKYPFGSDYYVPLLLLYYTGMRISEVLGLTWNDVDFRGKIIAVDKQLIYLDRQGYFFATPKNNSSCRRVSVDDVLIDKLKNWREQQKQNALAIGDAYVRVYRGRDNRQMFYQSEAVGVVGNADEVSLVCTRTNGKPVLYYNMEHLLKGEGLNAHSFRHTHATLLIENGATPKSVSTRLGHSSVTITQNLYTHVTGKMNEETVAIFSKLMQTSP